MPGVRCHAIQRYKYFVVYPANNYLLKCYGIHDIFLFFHIAEKWIISICKSWIFKIQSTHLKRLTLCFVDSHRKSKSNGKLESLKFKWHVGGYYRKAWNEKIFSFWVSVQNCRFDDFKNQFFFKASQVPLHIRGGLMLRRGIMGIPILSDNICCGIPGISNELKNSIG